MKPTKSWQNVIWREWRHCHDPDYARHLFALVADQPVGWGSKLSVILLNAAAGTALVVLAGLVFTPDWAVLKHLTWTGALLGGIRGYRQGQGLTWRVWLKRLASNTPAGNLSRLIFGIIALGLIGGMMFGPLFWLASIGLFWAFGEMITWIKSGLTPKTQDNLDERRWWFWWQKRPNLVEVENALAHACAASESAQEIWRKPLQQIGQDQHAALPVEVLTSKLLSNSWTERFLARHTLIRLGEEAIYPLQAITQEGSTPLQQTALWLLHNIEPASTPAVLQHNAPEAE